MSWKIWRSNELSPLRIVGIYLAVSWLWILSSDSFLHMMVGDRDLEATLQTGKSVLFVDVTALLFYFLSVRMVARLDQEIAERKRAEGELRKLTQAQLVQSAKLATLGEMAMAHELNQSLDVIKMAAASWIERIEDGAIDAEFAHGKFARIRAQIARATAIIDHMRIFGRADGGTPKPFDPVDAVTGALDLIGEQLRLRGIAVETHFPNQRRKVLGHAIQLEQVLLNLIGNARDAIEANSPSPEAPRKITLICEDTGPGNQIKLTVRDTGGGIPEDVLPVIFDPFFTTKEAGKGTGLGLSVSYGIVGDMGGYIEAANTEDGAEITISLPVMDKHKRES